MTVEAINYAQPEVRSRQNLEDLLVTNTDHLICSPEQVLNVSDHRIEILLDHPELKLSLRGSVTRGWEFADGHEHKVIHDYVYSDEFKLYEQHFESIVEDEHELERHFFTHGVEIGIWYKALSNASSVKD